MTHTKKFMNQVEELALKLDFDEIENLTSILLELRKQCGRLFVLGVGGSAANASHAVNDFRKLCGIEAYAPTDNAAELTARTNDEGWETVFSEWLVTSKISENDAVFVFSVGGGNVDKNVSVNLVRALQTAREVGAKILGVVGRDGGYTKKVGDAVVVIPTVEESLVTPYTEAFHSIVWHCLVSNPILQIKSTKW